MGLMDVLNGMQNGPRGQAAPSSTSSGGGMSPLTMALLGLLAYKTIKHFSPGQAAGNPTAPTAPPGGGGGLGSLLPGGLGSLLPGGGGAPAGNALSGGLGDLLKQFETSGHGATAKSWVGNEPNRAISPNDLASTLGDDQINALMEQSGMSRSELLSGLSQNLPDLVDKLTPDGRLPTAEEAGRML